METSSQPLNRPLKAGLVLTAGIVLLALALVGLYLFVTSSGPAPGAAGIGGCILAIGAAWFLVYAEVLQAKLDTLLAFPEAVALASGSTKDLKREYFRLFTELEGVRTALAAEGARTEQRIATLDRDRADLDALESRLANEMADRKRLEGEMSEFESRLVEFVRGQERLLALPDLAPEYSKAAERSVAEVMRIFGPLGFSIVRPAPGDRFDALIHEAVAQEAHSEMDPGSVLRVESWGFTRGPMRERAKVVLVASA